MPLSICELNLYENISRNLYSVIALFYNIKEDESLQPLIYAPPVERFMRRFEIVKLEYVYFISSMMTKIEKVCSLPELYNIAIRSRFSDVPESNLCSGY